MGSRRADGFAAEALPVVLGNLVGVFAVASFAYLAVLGFAGGTVPLLGWTLPGGAAHGLRWLVVLAGLGPVVLWFGPLLAALAVCATTGRARPVPATVARRTVRRPLKHAA